MHIRIFDAFFSSPEPLPEHCRPSAGVEKPTKGALIAVILVGDNCFFLITSQFEEALLYTCYNNFSPGELPGLPVKLLLCSTLRLHLV